ncbi:hypothetical protein LJR219_002668 [Phenylobacterium sp. LjRoot219]|uniref:calcium-binding protein n=1 Tax=Phenylobacterium sp. LjRoot219 TaxID=3342283 RepID=UPI003ECD6F58
MQERRYALLLFLSTCLLTTLPLTAQEGETYAAPSAGNKSSPRSEPPPATSPAPDQLGLHRCAPARPAATATSPAITVRSGTSVDQIQQIIDRAPRGSTIRLSTGTFIFDKPLLISRGDIALLGAGPDATRIMLHTAGGLTPTAIIVSPSQTPDRAQPLEQDLRSGSDTLPVGRLKVRAGDLLYIYQPNDETYKAALRKSDIFYTKTKSPIRETISEVTRIDRAGIRLSKPSPYAFSGKIAQIRLDCPLRNIDIGEFSIITDLPIANPLAFSNRIPARNNVATFQVENVAYSTFRDIKITSSASSAFQFTHVFRVHGEALAAIGASNKGIGGNGYAYRLSGGFENRFDTLYDRDMRHSFLFSAEHAEHYNRIEISFTNRNIDFHGSDDTHNFVRIRRSELYYSPDDINWTSVSDRSPRNSSATVKRNSVAFDWASGSRTGDLIQGADDGAHLDGRGGADTISGGRGNDTIIGGRGQDLLSGGPGRDVFVFRPGDGRDTILDFDPQLDSIDLSELPKALRPKAQPVGRDLLINLGKTQSILLRNTAGYTLYQLKILH